MDSRFCYFTKPINFSFLAEEFRIHSAPSSHFQKVAFWRPSIIIKWSPLKNFSRRKKKKNINNDNNNCDIQGQTLRVRYMNFYYAERICNP